MHTRTQSNRRRAAAAEAYWRRRALALTGVLASVGVLAWACGRGGEGMRDLGGTAALAKPTTMRGPGGATRLPQVLPTVTVTTTAKVVMRPTAVKRDGDACEAKNMVVDLTVDRAVFRGKENPQFRLSVVNTGTYACTMAVGPRELELRITSGADRVWSSAHCAKADGSSIKLLRRGIPYIATAGWDRRRSAPGCEGRRTMARPGTYVATVKTDKAARGIKVQREVFQLRAAKRN